jgi:uncharacterized membrane protein YdjX (TVP38/TMEM64 family)
MNSLTTALKPLQRFKRLARVGLFIGTVLAVVHFTGLKNHITLAYVQELFLANRLLGTLIFTLLFALGNMVYIPGFLFLTAAILALGPLWGGLVTYIAACAASALTFVIIRLLGGNALRQMRGKWVQKVLTRLDSHPLQSMLLLRTCLQTNPALNMTLALSGIPFRHYLLGTALGMPLPIAVYCMFFTQLTTWLKVPGVGG